MERIIKFRAWDGESIIYQSDEGWFKNIKCLTAQVPQTMQLAQCMKVCKVMQFTGLYDKNGKEIYEWDIISCYSGRYAVEFSEGGFSPFAVPEWEQEPHPKDCEVIGNVFQNPELLND